MLKQNQNTCFAAVVTKQIEFGGKVILRKGTQIIVEIPNDPEFMPDECIGRCPAGSFSIFEDEFIVLAELDSELAS